MSTESKGVAIVTRLAEDGYDIVVNDVSGKHHVLESLAGDIRTKGSKAIVVVGDVTVENDVKTWLRKQDFLSTDRSSSSRYLSFSVRWMICVMGTVEEFEKIFAVNVCGTYLCFRYAAKQMIKQGRIGSWTHRGCFVAFYCSTKWAIRELVTSVVKEVGRHGITVNAYTPGIVAKTPMWEDAKAKIAEGLRLQDADDVDKAETMNTAVGYLGKVHDVSNLVSFLVKKDSHFITGKPVPSRSKNTFQDKRYPSIEEGSCNEYRYGCRVKVTTKNH